MNEHFLFQTKLFTDFTKTKWCIKNYIVTVETQIATETFS